MSEFDDAYFRYAQELGSAADPTLYRDRLILLLLQVVSPEEGNQAIMAAGRGSTDVVGEPLVIGH